MMHDITSRALGILQQLYHKTRDDVRDRHTQSCKLIIRRSDAYIIVIIRRRRHNIIETRAHVLRGKSYLEESRNFFGARLSTDSFFRRRHAFSLCRDYSRKLVYRSSACPLTLSLSLYLPLSLYLSLCAIKHPIILFCHIKIVLLANPRLVSVFTDK